MLLLIGIALLILTTYLYKSYSHTKQKLEVAYP